LSVFQNKLHPSHDGPTDAIITDVPSALFELSAHFDMLLSHYATNALLYQLTVNFDGGKHVSATTTESHLRTSDVVITAHQLII
jgi:hypothetical protein